MEHFCRTAARFPTEPKRKRDIMYKRVNCSLHGTQGVGLVCEHVAFAIDRNERVGFHWGDDTDLARPDAWCTQCENRLVALNGASSAQWFKDAGFKIFCAGCWDEAKRICGGFPAQEV